MIVCIAALAAPLALYNPAPGDFSTTTPAPGCGDFSKPCQSSLGSAALNFTPNTGPGWTYGGSVSTGVAGISGAKGPATAVAGSLWARSPDGQWTVGIGIAHQTFPAWGYNYGPAGPASFGRH